MAAKYDGRSIEALEGLDPVRKRPGMYVGGTGSRAVHHLFTELLDNSVDEHLAGACTKIDVVIHEDGSLSVEDNGRGIPVDLHENTRDYPKEQYPNGICTERIILTVLHAGGKFNNNAYAVSGGLHGVGISVVNALSSRVKVEVFKDGKHYVDEYRDGGIPVTALKNGELKPCGKTEKCGTKITFFPDSTIFETTVLKSEVIRRKLKETSYLNKNLTLTFADMREPGAVVEIFNEPDGIVGLVRDMTADKEPIYEQTIVVEGLQEPVCVELAMIHTHDFNENVYSFVNNINTVEGGTHVTGFRSALTKVVNKYLKNTSKTRGETLDGKDIRSGLSAVLSIKHRNPQFEGQTKSKLGNSDAKSIVEDICSSALELYFDKNPMVIDAILEQSMKMFSLRKGESKARENYLKKNSGISANKKLAACQHKRGGQFQTELFIVEGDSAGGSAKSGRDRRYQAILSLWGKMLNVEKAAIDKVYENEKLAPIISAVGTGIGEDFVLENLKYDKIVIMADADVDGSHIRTLLMTFFYRYMRPVIENGHLYIAMPPLYELKSSKSSIYIYTDKELQKAISKIKSKYVITRFKGLGEMDADELCMTTMDPKTRKLKQVTIEDAIESEQMTSMLMGNDAAPRRAFIEENSSLAELFI